ncbi:MAG TPA: hypothetical protein VMV92_37025 [Streptosporangiaceae bacterium]|nr:hypothetical protein [Streptosporangiaceae bacterium]
MRWSGAETLIGENKSAITGAGPSLGPMLRSRTPHQVDQEMYAWLTACQALRITSHGALQAAAPAARRGHRRRAGRHGQRPRRAGRRGQRPHPRAGRRRVP